MSACAAAKPSSDSASSDVDVVDELLHAGLSGGRKSALAHRLSQIAPMIKAIDREPGSTWPSARSPRNDARPRLASRCAVASALSKAQRRTRATRSSPPAAEHLAHRIEHVEQRLLADLGLAEARQCLRPRRRWRRRATARSVPPAAPCRASPSACRRPAPTSRRSSTCSVMPIAFSASFSGSRPARRAGPGSRARRGACSARDRRRRSPVERGQLVDVIDQRLRRLRGSVGVVHGLLRAA